MQIAASAAEKLKDMPSPKGCKRESCLEELRSTGGNAPVSRPPKLCRTKRAGGSDPGELAETPPLAPSTLLAQIDPELLQRGVHSQATAHRSGRRRSGLAKRLVEGSSNRSGASSSTVEPVPLPKPPSSLSSNPPSGARSPRHSSRLSRRSQGSSLSPEVPHGAPDRARRSRLFDFSATTPVHPARKASLVDGSVEESSVVLEVEGQLSAAPDTSPALASSSLRNCLQRRWSNASLHGDLSGHGEASEWDKRVERRSSCWEA